MTVGYSALKGGIYINNTLPCKAQRTSRKRGGKNTKARGLRKCHDMANSLKPRIPVQDWYKIKSIRSFNILAGSTSWTQLVTKQTNKPK